MNFKSSKLTGNTTICSKDHSGKHQRKHQFLAFLTLCQVNPLWHGGLFLSIRLYGLRYRYIDSGTEKPGAGNNAFFRPRQNGRRFPDIFKWILLNENVWILITFSLNFVSRGQINNIPTLVQIMAWRPPGDKPLSEPMMVSLLIWMTSAIIHNSSSGANHVVRNVLRVLLKYACYNIATLKRHV